MNLHPVTDSNDYSPILIQQPHAEFLQSWEWGNFQEALGKDVWRWQDSENSIVGQAWLQPLPAGFAYIFAPRLGGEHDTHFLQQSLAFLQEKAAEKGAVFVRLEPLHPINQSSLQPVESMQPADTVITDVHQQESELLARMKTKTRYNIRLAERKGITVTAGVNEKSISDFLQLMRQTENRHDLSSHNPDYYKKLLEVLPQQKTSSSQTYVTLLSAHVAGRILASNLLIGCGDTLTYLFGASSNQDKNLMAPYLLQWETMRLAARNGHAFYDFFGIAPEDNDSKLGAAKRRQKWAGISRFKLGFGGEKHHYPGAFDLPERKIWYRLYRTWQTIRPAS